MSHFKYFIVLIFFLAIFIIVFINFNKYFNGYHNTISIYPISFERNFEKKIKEFKLFPVRYTNILNLNYDEFNSYFLSEHNNINYSDVVYSFSNFENYYIEYFITINNNEYTGYFSYSSYDALKITLQPQDCFIVSFRFICNDDFSFNDFYHSIDDFNLAENSISNAIINVWGNELK